MDEPQNSGVNKLGREYCTGQPLSEDFRNSIVREVEINGGNRETTIVPRGVKAMVSRRYRVTSGLVRKLWKIYCSSADVKPKSRKGTREHTHKLTPEDVDYVHTLKLRDPCFYGHEVRDKVIRYTNTPNLTCSLATIHRTIRSRLPGGIHTRKKVTSSHVRRWDDHNIAYTIAFFACMAQIDPRTVYFVDETSVNRQTSKRKFGTSPRGVRAVSITDHTIGLNHTLILLIGLNGCVYGEVETENVDALRFVRFISNAKHSFLNDGTPVLPNNSTIVLDNASIHVARARTMIRPFLHQFGIRYLFLPTYSPDLNPVEAAFMHIKEIIQSEPFSKLLQEDPSTCIRIAMDVISPYNIHQYFARLTLNYLGI